MFYLLFLKILNPFDKETAEFFDILVVGVWT